MEIIIPNVLYDDRQIEIFPLLVEEMKRQRIDKYNICSPILEGGVVTSISKSQKKIVSDARGRGDKECCIFEDDVYFPADDGWEYFLMNKPTNYDVYIGGSYLVDNRVNYIPRLVKVNEWVGNHCIIIHERYYDTFLATDETQHIDTAQKGKGEFYLCYPYAALQRPRKSANCNYELANYNTIIRNMLIYKG